MINPGWLLVGSAFALPVVIRLLMALFERLEKK